MCDRHPFDDVDIRLTCTVKGQHETCVFASSRSSDAELPEDQ